MYSVVTWLAMLAYGRKAWTDNGEAFAVYFGLLARIAPFGGRDGRLVVRWPFTGLANLDARPGTLAFIAVMLGSVAFDGFSQTDYWAVEVRAKLTREVIERSPDLADVVGGLVALTGLVLMIVLVALAYIAAMRIAARAVHYEGDLTDAFLGSLVPIALAYVVAHYFSFFVRESQYLAIFVSDPFGFGWDLFGTADMTPEDQRPGPEDDLVRPGRGARDRPRRRARPRPRQGCRALRLTAQGRHQPVRHAGADGRLHRRRPLAPVAVARGGPPERASLAWVSLASRAAGRPARRSPSRA